MPSFAHRHFWPKRLGCEHCRFCKECYPQEDDQPSVEDVRKILDAGFSPSASYSGCVRNESSPSSMINHLMHCRPELCQQQVFRGERDVPVDPELMREWALGICICSLRPLGLVDDPHVRKALAPRLKGLGSKATLQEAVDQTIKEIREQVKEKIAQARDENARFVISGDCWKPKMKRENHYLAVYLDWTSADWTHETVCASVKLARAPRNGQSYFDLFSETLSEVGVEKSELLGGGSYHEGAIRKGLRMLEVPLIGCACHAVQLSAKHALPPLREPSGVAAAAEASDDDSSDTDSSCSSTSSSSEDDVPAPAPKAKAKARGRAADPKIKACQNDLAGPFRLYRKTAKWYAHNPDARNDMDTDATEAGLATVAYCHETPTRWSSGLEGLISVILNNKAHQLSRAKRGTSAPEAMSDAQVKEAVHLCCVLEPIRMATKLLESDVQTGSGRGLASMYLPVWHTLESHLKARSLKVIEKLRASIGGQADIAVANLLPRAARLREFLIQDLEKIRKKHYEGTSGEGLFLAAAFLDPRFKDHACVVKAGVEGIVADVKKLALDSIPHYNDVVDRLKLHAQRPENQALRSLASSSTDVQPSAQPKAKGKGRGKGKRKLGKDPEAPKPGVLAGALKPQAKKRRELKERTSADDFLFQEPALDDADQRRLEGAQVDLEKQVEAELERYRLMPASRLIAANPLEFWRLHGWSMPHVALVAQHVLGAPASTANIERLFSAAGRAITRRRPRLQPGRAADLIFAHANAVRGMTGRRATSQAASSVQAPA